MIICIENPKEFIKKLQEISKVNLLKPEDEMLIYKNQLYFRILVTNNLKFNLKIFKIHGGVAA